MRPARARLFGVLGFLLLTLFVVYGAFAYLFVTYRNQLEAELGERLIAVAAATAAAVDDGTWNSLAAGDATLDARLRRELEEVRRTTGISDIFAFDTNEITVFDLGERYPVGEPNLALTLDAEAVTYALAGIARASQLYAESGAYLKSAYAPIVGDDGEIQGGIGVEASAAFVDLLSPVRRTLLGAATVVLLGVALLGFGFAKLTGDQASLEDRLRRTETLAAMGQMTAMLAHEIRNPLGIIRGAAERLGKRHALEEDELYRFIPEEVDRLERTLSAYLDFARPRTGDGIEDVRPTLVRTVELARHELERKGVLLAVDMEEGTFPVRGDPHVLQQAFLNVILNSRDAMPEGGELAVQLRQANGRAEIVFRDTGVGMSEDVRRRATEPFFTGKEQGSGLGLAVVRRVVDDLGGRLTITSRTGAGTEVTLAFPIRSA